MDLQQIKGFAGIHYACYYGRLEIVKLLVEHEYNLLTQHPVEIIASGIGRNHKFTLATYSTPLSVALLAKQPEVVNYLVSFIEQHETCQRSMLQVLNDSFESTYLHSTMCYYQEASLVYANKLFIQKEFFLRGTNMNPV